VVSFPPVSPPRPYTPLSSPIRTTCPAHLIFLDFITRTILGEEYKSFSSSLCNLLHYPVTSSLLGPNMLLNTVFSNTLSFFSSHNVNNQVSHLRSFLYIYVHASSFILSSDKINESGERYQISKRFWFTGGNNIQIYLYTTEEYKVNSHIWTNCLPTANTYKKEGLHWDFAPSNHLLYTAFI